MRRRARGPRSQTQSKLSFAAKSAAFSRPFPGPPRPHAAAGVALGEAPFGLARLLTGSSRAGPVGVAQVVWSASLAGASTVYTLSMMKMLLSSDKSN